MPILLALSLICTDKHLIVDLNKMVWTAYACGQVVRTGEAIGGRAYCPENRKKSCKTPDGTFTVYAKHGYGYRSGKYPVDCQNRRICGARMYYFMPFHRAGIGLHGSDMMVGRNESHGCVRLHKQDAKWLNQNFVEVGTKIIILPYELTENKNAQSSSSQ